VLPHEPAKPTAQGESGYAGRRCRARRAGEAEGLCGLVELAQRAARGHAGDATRDVDGDVPHRRAIDHQAAITGGVAGEAMATATHRDAKVVRAGEVDGALHVSDVGALGHRCGATVDRGVPDRARVVVRGVVGQHDAPS